MQGADQGTSGGEFVFDKAFVLQRRQSQVDYFWDGRLAACVGFTGGSRWLSEHYVIGAEVAMNERSLMDNR